MSEIKLNKKQKEAVAHSGSPLLVIAGAGTGKTTVITERIKWLIQEQGLKPEEILALTFTEKAANEMEERVDVALPMGFTQTWIMTFHGFCERVLRSDVVQLGLDPGFTILSEAETQMFIKEHLFEFDLDYFRPKGNPTKFISGLITHFSRLKDEDVAPNQYLEWVKGLKVNELEGEENQSSEMIEVDKYLELANAYKKYEELKVKHSVMDFADLISNTLKLFRQRPNVLKYYQQKFKHILIDEFQDTNYAQNHLAIMLAGDDKNITAVADDDQSIYRWRGAAVYNVLDFEKHFPNTKTVVLTDNYRSTQKILDHSYKLIQNNNPDRLEIKAKIDKKLVASNPKITNKRSKIKLIWEESVEDEAELVARVIKQQVSEKTKKSSRGDGFVHSVEKAGKTSQNESLRFNDFAILVRANDHAQPFARELRRQGVPYQFLGPGRLFKQNEIKDIIAYAQSLVDLDNSQAMYRVLTSPIININGRDIQWLITKTRQLHTSLFRGIEEFLKSLGQEEPDEIWANHGVSSESINKLTRLMEMMKRHMDRIPNSSPGEILYFFLEDTGELLKMRDPSSAHEARKVENISAFFNKIKAYEVGHPEGKLNDFVEYLNFLIDSGESPLASQIDWTENDAVNILTVHSAKGLEFDTVFLVNLVNQRFPTTNKKDKIPLPEKLVKEPAPEIDPHIGEERRLFYVGMTRAKRNLYLTGAKFYHEGSKRPKRLSPFVEEALGRNLGDYKLQASELKGVELEDKNKQNLKAIESFKPEAPTKQSLPLEEKYKVNYLSYSRIESFLTCPLHYKLEYILRIPKLPTAPVVFGEAVHNALRDVYKMLLAGQVKRDADEMVKLALEYYKMHWTPIGFSSKEHEKERWESGLKVIGNFIRQDLKREFELVEIEKPFEFNLVSDLRIGGRIDRIDRLPDGRLEIIDYKTGKVPDARTFKDKKLQLSIYALAMTNEALGGEKLENLLLTFYYLEHGERKSVEHSKEEMKEAKEKILEVREQIEKSDFECNHSYYCTHGCEYDLFCG